MQSVLLVIWTRLKTKQQKFLNNSKKNPLENGRKDFSIVKRNELVIYDN